MQTAPPAWSPFDGTDDEHDDVFEEPDAGWDEEEMTDFEAYLDLWEAGEPGDRRLGSGS